jgi:hypothetical protein
MLQSSAVLASFRYALMRTPTPKAADPAPAPTNKVSRSTVFRSVNLRSGLVVPADHATTAGRREMGVLSPERQGSGRQGSGTQRNGGPRKPLPPMAGLRKSVYCPLRAATAESESESRNEPLSAPGFTRRANFRKAQIGSDPFLRSDCLPRPLTLFSSCASSMPVDARTRFERDDRSCWLPATSACCACAVGFDGRAYVLPSDFLSPVDTSALCFCSAGIDPTAPLTLCPDWPAKTGPAKRLHATKERTINVCVYFMSEYSS